MRRRSFRPFPPVLVLAGLALFVGVTACEFVRPSPVPEAPREPERRTHLVLRLSERRLYLMHADPLLPTESFPIAIGREGHDTPTGQFHVEEMIEYPDFQKIDPNDRNRVIKYFPPGSPQNPLGERWIAFAHGYGWTVGIHGTPHPELLGKRVSGGCIRMRNADVIRIYSLVQLGTPVLVEP